VAAFLLILRQQEDIPIKRRTRRYGHITLATAAAVAAFAVQALAQAGGGWLLLVPPPIPEKRALIKVYAANSEAEVRAAVDSLPDDEQIMLVAKVHKILTIPTAIARTEALLDVLYDTSAPLPTWRQIGSFDSAASCERQRQLALQSFEREAARVRSSSPDSEELSVEDWRVLQGLSVCRKSRCVRESAFFPQ